MPKITLIIGLILFCQKEGIIHESCVKSPLQNRIADRKNGHLSYQTRAMLFQNKVPKFFLEGGRFSLHLI
jgi:hypothetical protein